MRYGVIVWVLLFFTVHVFAQHADDGNKKNYYSTPDFYYEMLNFASQEQGKTRVDIFVQLSYDKIRFVKTGDRFKGEYTVTVTFQDEDRDVILNERSWTETVETKLFEQSISPKNFKVSFKSFSLPAGIVYVKIAVEDKDSRKVYAAEQLFEVRNLQENITSSDLLMLASVTPSDAGNTISPNVPRMLNTAAKSISFFHEVYTAIPQSVVLRYTVFNPDKTPVVSELVERVTTGRATQIFYQVDSLPLIAGDYILSVQVFDSVENVAATIYKKFTSMLVGLPFIIRDLDKAIDQMIYIATNIELDSIRLGKNYEEKLKLFLDYWKRKDPNATTEENEVFNEYFRRVEFANRNFSHYNEGWRTDMGMVYIILGSPSNVERHPFDYNSKPYEIWEYYELNRRFVFLDNTGFGDYRLVTPLYGEMYRYRQ